VVNLVMSGLMAIAAVLATLPLVFLLLHLLREGASSIDLAFFTMSQPSKLHGQRDRGTSSRRIAPIDSTIGAGLYLAEQRGARLATSVRFLSDVLNGLPSIVMGIFAWHFLVRPVGHFSALAGGVALGAMMIPLVTRATEEMVRTVPTALREAALALGYPRWRTSVIIVLRTALPGIVTAALVAIARIAGETAPLLFTSFGNSFWSTSLDQPIAALPHQIYTYAITPYDDWHRLAWAGSLVLIGIVLVISILARFVTRSRYGGVGD
jgi:phosphate transport system permease protein